MSAKTLNIENIKRVRDHIATLPPERLEMWHYFSAASAKTPLTALKDCGTAACIAGWTLAVLAPRTRLSDDWVGVDEKAAERLGLDLNQGDALFRPAGWGDEHFTPSQVVAVLDHLIETGEVDWSSAKATGETL